MDHNTNTLAEHAETPRRRPLILLTGATGYIGGRMLTRLEDAGYEVRCLTRRPEELAARIKPGTEAVFADILDPASLDGAMRGGDIAYYLVHSMGSAKGFEEKDRAGAKNFGEAARKAGVRRIIYLGGLGEESEEMSEHLRSRQEVGHLLRESGVQVIEFRASIVIGSGSLSFEMVRALVERLPVMIAPRWVAVTAQPIGIDDLQAYLLAAVTHDVDGSQIYEIGGADQVSYGDIMTEYARQRGLRRLTIPVPVLTPRLSSLWLGLVTPVYSRVGRKLISSIKSPTVVRDPSALRAFPVTPMGLSEAVARAIRNEDQEIAATRWSDALSASGESQDWMGVKFGNRLVESRTATVQLDPERAFAPIRRIGGKTGWYGANKLWLSRGFIDLLAGGVGVRRGRRDPERLRVGDTVDWWRVEVFEPDRRLRLSAEMRLAGRAWLEFEVTPDGDRSTIRQTAIFDPAGLSGLAYWYVLYPGHHLIFSRMLRNIVAAAETPHESRTSVF
ncbi:SDR family oxidoreductase [soil metagenome]